MATAGSDVSQLVCGASCGLVGLGDADVECRRRNSQDILISHLSLSIPALWHDGSREELKKELKKEHGGTTATRCLSRVEKGCNHMSGT